MTRWVGLFAIYPITVWADTTVDAESTTLFLGSGTDRYDPASGDTNSATAATFLEIERVTAYRLGASPWLGDLSLHQSGWFLGDVGAQTRERPATGNLRTLYLEYARGPVELRMGRQFVAGGATRFAHIDGAALLLRAPFGTEVSLHGGFVALPRFVESPYYARLGPRLSELVSNDVTLEPRSARGFAIVGGRLGHAVPNWGRTGVSFVEEAEAGQLARRALGFDASLERRGWAGVETNAIVDVAARELAEARASVDLGPWKGVSADLSYRREDPTLLVSKTSIFSVFATTAYDEAGAELTWRRERLVLEAGGFGLHYVDGEPGVRLRAGAIVTAGSRRPVRARASYQRLQAPERGYHGASASVTVDGLGPCRAAAEVWAFLFDEEATDATRHSITPQLSVGTSRFGVDLDGALGFHTGPRETAGLFGMVKATMPMGYESGRRSMFRAERTRAMASDAQGDHITFSHRKHADAGALCEDCHAGATTAGREAKLLPKEEACLECHEEGRDKKNCTMCHSHPDRPSRLVRADRALVFEHRTHVEKRKCEECHTQATTSERVTDNLVPDMAACLTCHEHRREVALLDCHACHARMPASTQAPLEGWLSHGGDFQRRHQDIARGKSAACAACHDQAFCGDCHERLAPTVPATLYAEQPNRAAFHRGYYLDRHAAEARAEPASCLRCHGRTSCDSCHLERGISGVSRGAVSPHPRGWVDGHGPTARRNLLECASCHDQGPASNCVACHRPGGSGGSPHGAGFTSPLDMNDARVCSTCHAGGTP